MKGLKYKIFNETNLIILFLLLLFGFCFGWNECCRREYNSKIIDDRDVLFQVATFKNLMFGDYDGKISLKQLSSKGDFGIGTFQGLDGEMILMNGKFYQIKTDGKVYKIEDSALTPYAAVTFFDNEKQEKISQPMDYKRFVEFLDNLTKKDFFYAIRVTGFFTKIKVRSVPKYSKPYPKFLEALKEQVVFELKDIKGSLVGFKYPNNIGKINLSGYHFHFISDDFKCGGHVLDFQLKEGEVSIDETNSLLLDLPKKG